MLRHRGCCVVPDKFILLFFLLKIHLLLMHFLCNYYVHTCIIVHRQIQQTILRWQIDGRSDYK